jgi:hypothetical protein
MCRLARPALVLIAQVLVIEPAGEAETAVRAAR